jgi:hypothetical protein
MDVAAGWWRRLSGRDLLIQRPVCMAKETYLYGKRDLLIWQKRPTYMAKETYLYGKSDLLIWQKRPTVVEEALR